MPKKQPSLATGSFNQICRFTRDNASVGGFTLSCDGGQVDLTNDATGAGVGMSRANFNRLVRLYLKPRRYVRGPV